MLRFAKWVCGALVLAAGAQVGLAFSFWGTKEAYQTDNIGYGRYVVVDYQAVGFFTYFNEITFAPHNLGEEYRWSVPVLYYAYDASFLDYFGSNGVTAVDSAVGILNSLPKTSQMSPGLTEFPLQEIRPNYTAIALHVFDIKSAALEMLVTRLGLGDPERWAWVIRDRVLIPGSSCPFYVYNVIQRNFDPFTLAPSRYVNGNLFTYSIDQHCPPETIGDVAIVNQFLVDSLSQYQTTVSSPKVTFPYQNFWGWFHTGLTRDDVGGLRYLYGTNNLNVEQSPPDSTFFQTNFNSQLQSGSNLTLLAAQALTNNAATLSTLFPGLVITATTNTFTNVYTTNLTAYFTNFPWDPFGTPAHLAFATNWTVSAQTLFHHTFANLMLIEQVGNGFVTVPVTQLPAPGLAFLTTLTNTIVATNFPWSPPGNTTIVTNSSSRTTLTNLVTGEFFIATNTLCDIAIIAVQLTNVIPTTNITISATNNAAQTNVANTILSFQQSQVTYFTNHAFVVYPVSCVTNSVALRQGLEKISFVRHDFDSLLGRFFAPVTNNYTMTAVTNNLPIVQKFQRIVTRPDITFAAADLPQTPTIPTVDHLAASLPSLNASNAVPGLAGPGTFEGPMTLTFNKVGPIYLNEEPDFGDEASAIFYYQWGSFDGSTNAPILYPIGTSIYGLEQQVFARVSPTSVPAGRVGFSYSAGLTVFGGQPPYTWSVAPSSGPLPPGLTLSQDPNDSSQAIISGTTIVQGAYLFSIRVSDSGSLTFDTAYGITVYPP